MIVIRYLQSGSALHLRINQHKTVVFIIEN